MIRPFTTFTSTRYRNICDLSRDFMQIRIRDLYRAAPETVQRATHAFAGPIENMGIDHSRVLRLRSCRRHAFNKKIVSRADSAPGCFTPLGVEDNRKKVKRQKEKGKKAKGVLVN
jgi:hypothetical protein